MSNAPDAMMPPPPYGAPSQAGWSPVPPAPLSQLVLNVQGMALIDSFMVPRATIDGHLVSARYGATPFWVQPGRHRIEMQAQWPWPHGRAVLDVDLPANGAVEVFYAAPWHSFCRRGNIGFVRQSRPGLLPSVALGGIVAFFLAVLFVVAQGG